MVAIIRFCKLRKWEKDVGGRIQKASERYHEQHSQNKHDISKLHNKISINLLQNTTTFSISFPSGAHGFDYIKRKSKARICIFITLQKLDPCCI